MAASLTCSTPYRKAPLSQYRSSWKTCPEVHGSSPSAPCRRPAQEEFQASQHASRQLTLLHNMLRVCMLSVGGWVVSWPDVYEADLSQRCLFLVIRNTWTKFRRGTPAREVGNSRKKALHGCRFLQYIIFVSLYWWLSLLCDMFHMSRIQGGGRGVTDYTGFCLGNCVIMALFGVYFCFFWVYLEF